MNAKKIKCMVIKGPKQTRGDLVHKSSRDGEKNARVTRMKFLGVIIDDRLNFAAHSAFIVQKVGKNLSFLTRLGKFVLPMTRCIVYKIIVAAHLEYCSTILMNMNKTDIEKLQRMQNRTMRVIL